MRSVFLLILFHFTFWKGESQIYHHYFGNLHAHTGFSDGNKDSLITGVSKPDGSYAFAKLSQDFDFLGISEHNHYSSANNPGFEHQNFQLGLNMASTANQEGLFICLFGMEYGVSSTYNGHVVIYGFNQLIGWENGNYDIFNAKSDYDGLFRKVKNNPSAFCYLAHPYYTDFSNNGAYSGALALAPYNSAYDSAIVGVSLRSGLAFSQAVDYSDYSTGDYTSYFKQLLFKGYHLGIGYDHDNHYTNFGRSNGGRLVILATSLTRQNLTDAMQKMRFYGSDDSNAEVDFTLNGNVMGSITQGTSYPVISLTHNDPDGENADSIKIWRGAANTGTLWAELIEISKSNNTVLFTDYNIVPNKEYYYFCEIKQQDGQWIMTSPIWYTGLGALSIAENENELWFQMYQNPFNNQLFLSFDCSGEVGINVFDLSGKSVYHYKGGNKELRLDLENYARGLYILEFMNNNKRFLKKLVIY